jgi:hypothetical protein
MILEIVKMDIVFQQNKTLTLYHNERAVFLKL